MNTDNARTVLLDAIIAAANKVSNAKTPGEFSQYAAAIDLLASAYGKVA